MKITIGCVNGFEYENHLNSYWEINELLDSIIDNDGWLVIEGKGCSRAFKKENIVWLNIEIENVDEMCEFLERQYERQKFISFEQFEEHFKEDEEE